MTHFISHYSFEGDVLSYDLTTGAHQRIHLRQVPRGRALDNGSFVEVGGHIYGVVASENGPVFFRDAARTQLVQGRHKAQVTKGAASHRFSLTEDGQELLAVWYQRTEPDYVNPYDQEVEESDFFTSLEGRMATERFYKWHTQAPTVLSAYGEYLWVWDRQAGDFVGRYRVLAAGERAEDLPDGDSLQGTVPVAESDAFFDSLRQRFPGPRYECSSTNATSWEVVAKQARALRDYEHP